MTVSRRDVLKIAMGGSTAWALGARTAWGLTPVKAAHVTNVLYSAHLVAESGGFFKKEGVAVELVNSPAGARSAQMVAAAQVHYVLGDTGHPQRLTEQGKPAVVLYVTDQKCPYANMLVRKDLHQAGLTSIDKLAALKPRDGGKWKAGATAIGSGTWMYGNFVLRARPTGDGKTLNDLVEWVGLGGTKASLGALKTGKTDIVMAVPEMIFEAEAQAIGVVLFDVREDKQWQPVFKGPISATGAYTLKSTVQQLKDETQAYVTAVYRAVQWIKAASPAEVGNALERYQELMGLSRESVVKAVEWYKPVWTYDMVFSRENYDNVLNVAKGIKAEKTYPYEEIVDGSFLRKASGKA